LVSNWSGGRSKRGQADGRRSVFLDNIVFAGRHCDRRDGAVFVSSYSGDII